MNKKINGLVAAPLTGFNSDGSVKFDVIPRYAAMLNDNGVVGVFVNGTAGEGAALRFDERLALAECWVHAAPKGLRVIIHVGYADQEESRALAVHAAEIGAAGIGEIGPTIKIMKNVEMLVEYTTATASASPELPYYYYHMPSVNDLYFPMIDYLSLAANTIPQLAGIKFTHDNISDYKLCKEYKDGKFDILFGRDEFLLDGLKVGALGAVGSTYNIMAVLYLDLITAFHDGDLETAKRLQNISATACRLIHETGGFISGLKFLMKKIGLDLGTTRAPQSILSKRTVENLESSLENTGMFNYLNRT